jgi:iron(III) transport system substrate-binding protein
MRSIARTVAAVVFTAAAVPAAAQAALNVVCSVQLPWCQAVVDAFQKRTGVEVGMMQKTASDALAQITLERAAPRIDLWFLGSGEAHLQAAESGLTEEYVSPGLPQLHPWALREAEDSGFRAVGVYLAALGIGYNKDIIDRKNLPSPRCWADLADPAYRGGIQMAHPGAAGIGYATVTTYLQIFGEGKGFELLKGLHRNTGNYSRSGAGAIRAVARGEAAIGVTFLHDGMTEVVGGFPVAIVVPCEGTGFEIASMSIVKGAPNLGNAKKFYDWALTPEAQKIGGDLRNFQIPSNVSVQALAGAPKMDEIKLIDYRAPKYGSAAERRRILEKWEREVYALPR